jgi:sugar lactone lactonase YvrE
VKVELFCNVNCQLGEGGLWHNVRGSFFWVDITARKIYEKSLDSHLAQWEMNYEISALFINPNDRNRLWVLSENGLLDFSLLTSKVSVRHPLKGLGVGIRTNDAGIDPSGCLVYGTMLKNPNNGAGAVYALNKKGEITTLIDNVVIPNSFIWCKNGTNLYSADSSKQVMYQYNYDTTSKTANERQMYISLTEGGATPDGSAIDKSDNIWNAQWGGGVVTCYNKDGGVVDTIELPVSRPTSCTFGGKYNDLLFITSAIGDLTPSQLEIEPLAGSVFMIKVPVKGATHNSKELSF